ncbi:MAG: acyl carrier protein [Chitinophagaceae bacterium]
MSSNKNEETLGKIQEVFKQAMGNHVTVDMNTDKSMIEEWDSLNHLNLIVELEGAFGLDLSMKEIEELTSVKKIVEIINARAA